MRTSRLCRFGPRAEVYGARVGISASGTAGNNVHPRVRRIRGGIGSLVRVTPQGDQALAPDFQPNGSRGGQYQEGRSPTFLHTARAGRGLSVDVLRSLCEAQSRQWIQEQRQLGLKDPVPHWPLAAPL